MRGSKKAYERSAMRLMTTNTTATRSTMPWTTGKSDFKMQSTVNLPMPGQEKMLSVSRAPHNSEPNCRPITVVTGIMELRSACLLTTLGSMSPLARAVRM